VQAKWAEWRKTAKSSVPLALVTGVAEHGARKMLHTQEVPVDSDARVVLEALLTLLPAPMPSLLDKLAEKEAFVLTSDAATATADVQQQLAD
jgi:hypothetical protein